MAQPQPVIAVGTITFSRVLMLIACILFVIAALAAGGVFTTVSPWAFGFGGFAAVALAWAVP
jgi:hypothetical protein